MDEKVIVLGLAGKANKLGIATWLVPIVKGSFGLSKFKSFHLYMGYNYEKTFIYSSETREIAGSQFVSGESYM